MQLNRMSRSIFLSRPRRFGKSLSVLVIDIIAEDESNKGRVDLTLTIKAGRRTFLFEFKVTDGEPLEQIMTMKYYEKYEGERYLIGIVFDPKAKNVSRFEWEKLYGFAINPEFPGVKSYNLLIFNKLRAFYAFCTHVNYVEKFVLYEIN